VITEINKKSLNNKKKLTIKIPARKSAITEVKEKSPNEKE
jgi:hypothetical protein